MKHNASLSVSFLIFSLSLSAFATEVNNASFIAAVEKSIIAVKKGEPFRLVDIPLVITDDSLQLLERYKQDPSPDVREAAYTIYFTIGLHSKEKGLRQRTVDNLIEGLFDPSILVREHIMNNLQSFSAEDFSHETKDKLMTDLKAKPDNNVVLAVGLANVQESLPILAEIRSNEAKRIEHEMLRHQDGSGLYQTQRWDVSGLYRASLLASGRMGIKSAAEEYINRLESVKDLSTRVYFIKSMQYMPRPEVIEYLKRYLNSNEYVGGEGDVVKVYVASIAADMLFKMVDGFPRRQAGEREEDYIVRGRAWISENPL